jgi:curved DNA-binding protein
MAVQFRDYYETLGVSKTASQDEIRKAFRKLARQFHPDVAKDKKAAEAKFKEINEAYEVLGDPEKRRKYDELGADWQQRAGGFGQHPGRAARGRPQYGMPEGVEFEFGGTGFSDFFEAFFGSRGGFAGDPFTPQGMGAGMRRGADAEADILVTLEEVLHGSKRQISLQRGEKIETYSVTIPKGVREGQRIRLAGQGSKGHGGGKAGDLYLNVRIERHPDYQIDGSDLLREVPLQPWQAVLGAELTVPTLDGQVRMKVPPGTEQGQRFRLRGKGLPKSDGTRGDFYAVAEIEIPKSLSPKERAVWEELARVSG